MPLLIRLFAGLKNAHGPEYSLEISCPVSVLELRRALESNGVWSSGARIAVNQQFACDESTVSEGDEVAVIPPVSGGAR